MKNPRLRRGATVVCCTALFGLLLAGPTGAADAKVFELENSSSANLIYGRCGNDSIYNVGRYGSRELECAGQFHVLYWTDEKQTDVEVLESYSFDCAGGQTKVITVSDVDPYSDSVRCGS